MNKIKSLADQLRDRIATPEQILPVSIPKKVLPALPKISNKSAKVASSDLIQQMLDYDSSSNRAMVHVKLDDETAKLVRHFKMATGIDNVRLGAFAIKHLFDTNPELKQIIKQYTQNLEL